MSTLKIREVHAALRRKGFEAHEGDHTVFHLLVDGKRTTIKTKYSHGEKEIGDFLIMAMSKQVKLKKNDFLRLIECPLSHEDYINLLRKAGHLQQ